MSDTIVGYMSLADYRQSCMDEVIDCLKCQDWQRLSDYVLMNNWLIGFAVPLCSSCMPDDVWYDFIVQSYTDGGDHLPCVRKAVRGLRKYGSPKLPSEIADKEFITVYRGGTEDISKAAYRISWTTNRETAEWFKERQKFFGKEAHVYTGTIRTDRILAYSNDREEYEVMQYRSVKDIEMIE